MISMLRLRVFFFRSGFSRLTLNIRLVTCLLQISCYSLQLAFGRIFALVQLFYLVICHRLGILDRIRRIELGDGGTDRAGNQG